MQTASIKIEWKAMALKKPLNVQSSRLAGLKLVTNGITPRVRAEKNKNYEHSHNPFDHPDCFAYRRAASVALQRRLGLLSKRRFRLGRPDFSHSFVAWKIMTVGLRQKRMRG
jgi:hypothetical protein